MEKSAGEQEPIRGLFYKTNQKGATAAKKKEKESVTAEKHDQKKPNSKIRRGKRGCIATSHGVDPASVKNKRNKYRWLKKKGGPRRKRRLK